MSTSDSRPAQGMWGGSLRLLLAESLLLPTGLVTAAFLTRRLGPQSYGLLTLAAVVVGWVEWGIASVFSRATIKLASQSEDWKQVGTLVLRAHLLTSSACTVLLWFLAAPIAALLNEDELTGYLRLFAIDIPLFSLAHAHRDLLIGRGKFQQRALGSAGRWISKLVIILVLVQLGFSVPGAIAGSIGASLVELAISRIFIRPSPWGQVSISVREVLDYAVPLFLFAAAMQLYDRLDILLLKILGGTAEQAGYYGAAQNLSVAPGLFALSVSPLLLSTLTRLRSRSGDVEARVLIRNALRAVLALFPLAAVAASCAPEIVSVIFGASFEPVGPIFRTLIFGAVGMVMISICTATLTSAGKPGWTFALTAPMLPIAAVAHLLVIPVWGAAGAALVTTIGALLGAAATLIAVHVIWSVHPPISTAVRAVVIGGLVCAAAALWDARGYMILLEISMLAAAVPLCFWFLGELEPGEAARVRGLFGRSH